MASKCQPHVGSVQILGSWDNFNQPYPLCRDNRIGREHWSGCHTYENIVCDGDLQTVARPRRGGLKMGGTYWYYYILDGNFETFDEAQPTTNKCPLLPGQTVNILEVPFEECEEPSRRASISAVAAIPGIHTLKPADRFQKPRPDSNPKYSRILTCPSKLQKEINAKTPTDTFLGVPQNDSLLARSPTQSHSADPRSLTEKAIRDSDRPATFEPTGFAEFDFNNFQVEVHDADEISGFVEEEPDHEEANHTVVRPRSDDYYTLSWPAKIGHVRHNSLPTRRFNSAPATFSPLGSHPVSDVLQERLISSLRTDPLSPQDQNQNLGLVYADQIPAATTQLYLPTDAGSTVSNDAEVEAEPANWTRHPWTDSYTFGEKPTDTFIEDGRDPESDRQTGLQLFGSDQWSYSPRESISRPGSASQSLGNRDYSFEPNSPSSIPDYSNSEQHGFDFMSSPTCGSLTEDVSDESFVASSASSDIWSPRVHRPLRLQSPSIDFNLDPPSSSESHGFQPSFDNDITGAFHGYSLPDEAGQSQLTLTKIITPKTTPRLRSDSRDGLPSHEELRASKPSLPTLPKMDSLLDDLGYLGDAIS